ncbi:MAG: thioredoxin domain-containing protein [Pirellulales bacterium]
MHGRSETWTDFGPAKKRHRTTSISGRRGLPESFFGTILLLASLVPLLTISCSRPTDSSVSNAPPHPPASPPAKDAVPKDPTREGDGSDTRRPPVEKASPAASPADDGIRGNEPRASQPSQRRGDRQPAKGPINRLAKETSPYLLMHAHNPVDWYPWGEEALHKARTENRLIFLSIGYSSCYWCHVMERETFSDPAIAKFMNEHFVCIKVDREERPDIDDIYMKSLQVFFQIIHSSQGGGWPLSMFLTPDAEPIMGGTYFPPRANNGRAGFEDVLKQVSELWQSNPDEVRDQGRELTRVVRRNMETESAQTGGTLDQSLIDGTISALADQFDPEYGGFGYSETEPQRPKFPEPSRLIFLLEQVERRDVGDAESQRARKMAIETLEKMAEGGIRDHLGGGFHRYSTDRSWTVPHFEKMLYDNAQLASAYARAHALTTDEAGGFRQVVAELADFIAREMTDAQGAFYSSIDAETDGEEGQYYVWSRQQIEAAVSERSGSLFAEIYGVDQAPNFEDHYILQLRSPLSEVAERHGTTVASLEKRLDPIRQRLLAMRSKRPRPRTDTKILTAWNGLMIRGLADAGRIFETPKYVAAATRAAEFVLEHLRTPEGRLMRTYRGGEAKLNAYLEDYAFLVDGLIALHQATDDPRWLEAARQLTDMQIDLFWDATAGGFYFTSHDHETLIARGKKPTDGALPAGNSVTAANLLYLRSALDRPDYLDYAEKTLRAARPFLTRVPAAMPCMAMALDNYLRGAPEPSEEQETVRKVTPQVEPVEEGPAETEREFDQQQQDSPQSSSRQAAADPSLPTPE